eukprot:3316113-Alexandrium_andersonii.AAC.1
MGALPVPTRKLQPNGRAACAPLWTRRRARPSQPHGCARHAGQHTTTQHAPRADDATSRVPARRSSPR